jgi:hypothetical protein
MVEPIDEFKPAMGGQKYGGAAKSGADGKNRRLRVFS